MNKSVLFFLIMVSSITGQEKIMTIPQDFGGNEKQINDSGETILFELVRRGDVEGSLELLASEPASANQPTNYGASPLHLAARPNVPIAPQRRVALIKALLDSGADKKATYKGKTPLQIYTEDETIQDPKVVALLTTEDN